LAALTAARSTHPCQSCAQRKQHQRTIHRRDQLTADRLAVDERLERQSRREQQRIDRLVGGIAAVLEHYGYLVRGQPTAKAVMLANIYDVNGLLLAEAIDRGWFDELEADGLAEVCSWFAYDRESKFTNRYPLSGQLLGLRRDLEELQWRLLEQEQRHDLTITTGFNRLFYGAVRAWCRGEELAGILGQIELSEGELVTTFAKTIDLLRQLREMLLQAQRHSALRERLEWAIKLVQRDIVEQSSQLGFLLTPAPSSAPIIPAAATEP
jgi:ATP-dependent RNA helicase HelY